MKYYIEIDERDIDRFRIDDPCKGSHGNDVLVLEDKYHCTIGFELLKERLHGEWIYHKYDKDFECSMCHYRFDEDEFGLEIPQENGTWVKVCVYNFCPNCGASMLKEGEAE